MGVPRLAPGRARCTPAWSVVSGAAARGRHTCMVLKKNPWLTRTFRDDRHWSLFRRLKDCFEEIWH
jgi:hypothetical protein